MTRRETKEKVKLHKNECRGGAYKAGREEEKRLQGGVMETMGGERKGRAG